MLPILQEPSCVPFSFRSPLPTPFELNPIRRLDNWIVLRRQSGQEHTTWWYLSCPSCERQSLGQVGNLERATLWSIWKGWKKTIFENRENNSREVIYAAKQLALDIVNAFPARGRAWKEVAEVKWKRPEEGWHKLNTDGSVWLNDQSAAAREWPGKGELRRTKKIAVEIDSKVVVNLIYYAKGGKHPLGCIIEDYSHTSREEAIDVRMNWLELGHLLEQEKVVWDTPPEEEEEEALSR
ncbi:hypothetical protein Pfo_009925 [Paulownia fortunei]|nr:hypothetical protein Pfo_009925 [Paulownia fortunei]